MLKIKDDVDLKDLEKYGFEYNELDFNYVWKNRHNVNCLIIDTDTYNIINYGDKNAQDIFYDLITAGLVEKVEERN